jgi:hypothetical protein
MPRIWRVFAALIIAAGLGLTAMPAASAATSPVLTISASSPFMTVSGHTWVYYAPAADDTVHISFTEGNGNPGDTAAVYARPFGASGFTQTGGSVTLPETLGTDGYTAAYTFTVHPHIATQYEVKMTRFGTAFSSNVQVVYVTDGFKIKDFRQSCSHHKCVESYRRYVQIPHSAYKSEAAKHWYLYFAATGTQPAYLKLAKDASASAAHYVTKTEFYVTVTFRFHSKSPNPPSFTFACMKDSEGKNGIGLPGHHGCGDPKVSSTSPDTG